VFTHDRAFVFSHVKPESADFDPRLRDGFRALLRDGGALASFHGHEHRYESYVQDGVPYFIAAHANTGRCRIRRSSSSRGT
jgi:hypothetical protein